MEIKTKIELNADDITQELKDYIRINLPHIINETLFESPSELNKLIEKAVYGIFMNEINSVVQGRDFRAIIRDRIYKHINFEDITKD